MQVLTIIIPYSRPTSNFALSCVVLRRWLSSNGFPIKTSKGDLSLENLSFYKSLDYPDLTEWTREKVFRAIQDYKPEYLQLLLQGADIEAQNMYGETPLILAARCGKTDCLKIVLESRANVEAKDNRGNMALSFAARAGDSDCLNLLLEHRVDIEATDEYGFTALSWAAINDRTEFVKLLLENGATVSPEQRINYPQYADLW